MNLYTTSSGFNGHYAKNISGVDINLLDIISSYSTLIVALIAIFTLIEIYRQRKYSFKPELIISSQPFYIIKYTKSKIPLIWKNNIKRTEGGHLPESDSARKNELYELLFYNIGLGTAKNIKVTFSTNLKETIDHIKKLDKDNILNIESEDLSKVTLKHTKSEYFGHEGKSIFFIENANKREIDYILPSQIEKKSTNIIIPAYYTYFYSIMIYLWNKHGFDIDETLILPTLDVTMEYKDIGNKKYKRKAEIIFDFSGTSVLSTEGNSKIKYN